MKPDFRNTFQLAFERGLLPSPANDQRWLVFNGHVLPGGVFETGNALFEQGFRPAYLDLERAGMDVVPQFDPDSDCDHAAIFAGRVRAVNEANFARAWRAVKPGGCIVLAGDKTTGIASLRKFVGRYAEITDSFSKHHAVCFWCTKPASAQKLEIPDGAKPIFSSAQPDHGSAMLAGHFNDRIRGKVADFGAGDGYLTRQLLKASGKIASVHLLEAEWAALELAKASLADAKVPVSFHWVDITSELKKQPLDWVIMNPPFHHGLHGGGKPDPDLGRSFIAQAASTLVQGGRLLMVANRKLAYEAVLDRSFRRTVTLEEKDGFKVIEATR